VGGKIRHAASRRTDDGTRSYRLSPVAFGRTAERQSTRKGARVSDEWEDAEPALELDDDDDDDDDDEELELDDEWGEAVDDDDV
jgi:hypothetical protein